MSNINFAMKNSIYNWMAVSVLLMLIEFLAFSLNETVLKPKIVDHEVGFASVERFSLLSGV